MPKGFQARLTPEQQKHLLDKIRSGSKDQGRNCSAFWGESICHQPHFQDLATFL